MKTAQQRERTRRAQLKSAVEFVREAEQLLRDAADHLASHGYYRRAGRLVRRASQVETDAVHVEDEIEYREGRE